MMPLVYRRRLRRTSCVRSFQSIEQFHQARLVRITNGRLAICLHPFGMLEPQIVVNLSPKLSVSMDLVKHGYSRMPRDGSSNALTKCSTSDCVATMRKQPSKHACSGGTAIFAGRTTLSRFDRFFPLTSQQHCQESALRQGLS